MSKLATSLEPDHTKICVLPPLNAPQNYVTGLLNKGTGKFHKVFGEVQGGDMLKAVRTDPTQTNIDSTKHLARDFQNAYGTDKNSPNQKDCLNLKTNEQNQTM